MSDTYWRLPWAGLLFRDLPNRGGFGNRLMQEVLLADAIKTIFFAGIAAD
jgi:hypothetical protein